MNFWSCKATFNSSPKLGVDGVLSVLLVVEDDTTGATGWSWQVSFVDLLSAGLQTEITQSFGYKSTITS